MTSHLRNHDESLPFDRSISVEIEHCDRSSPAGLWYLDFQDEQIDKNRHDDIFP